MDIVTIRAAVAEMLQRIGRAAIRKLVALLTVSRDDRIVLLQESFSGSNSYALCKLAGEGLRHRYDIILYRPTKHRNKGLMSFIREERFLCSARLIAATHGSMKPTRRHISLQLWHALALKGIALTERHSTTKAEDLWRRVDYAISYGTAYTTSMSASVLTDPRKFVVTGGPRNDFLFKSDGLSNISRIFGEGLAGKKIVFFMPTFREGYGRPQGNKSYGNPFGFSEFNASAFDRALEELNCKIVMKPHPHDEPVVLGYLAKAELANLLVLRESDLEAHRCDVYELLNASSALVTDYSSVCFDYLLIDRPMIFCPVDLESYRSARGFLFEPYDRWTAGAKALTQPALEMAIAQSLKDPAWFAAERAFVRDIVHHHQDGSASERVWQVIEDLLNGKEPRWRDV